RDGLSQHRADGRGDGRAAALLGGGQRARALDPGARPQWRAQRVQRAGAVTGSLSDIVGAARPKLLVGGGASEGPLWHPQGFLTFVRLDLAHIVRWDTSRAATATR